MQTAAPTARVLVVDDEVALREMLTSALVDVGYAVSSAEDGQSAVEQVQRRPDAVDLVILDLDLPRLGGVETATLLRAIRPSLPVLLTSGHGVPADAGELLAQPRTSFLAKPFRISAVRQRLDELLAG